MTTIRDAQPPDDDPQDLARRLALTLRKYPEERKPVRRILEDMSDDESRPRATARPSSRKVSDPEGRELPPPALKAAGQKGMILPQGRVGILAAEGGIGKSALTSGIALATAMAPTPTDPRDTMPLHGGIFEGRGGSVLILTYEDEESTTRWRINQLAIKVSNSLGHNSPLNACEHIHVLGMNGWPLFGPATGATYSSRPSPLEGWSILWEETAYHQPAIIIVDPVMDAYVGPPTETNPVREFYRALHHALSTYSPRTAMLLTAHSTKTARSGNNSAANPFDPGLVAGSAAWTDTPRGVMTMIWSENQGHRILSIPKSNLGPQHITIPLDTISHEDGYLLGMTTEAKWSRPNAKTQSELDEWKTEFQATRNHAAP